MRTEVVAFHENHHHHLNVQGILEKVTLEILGHLRAGALNHHRNGGRKVQITVVKIMQRKQTRFRQRSKYTERSITENNKQAGREHEKA